MADAPRWDLGAVYPGLDSTELAEAIRGLDKGLTALERYLARDVAGSARARPRRISRASCRACSSGERPDRARVDDPRLRDLLHAHRHLQHPRARPGVGARLPPGSAAEARDADHPLSRAESARKLPAIIASDRICRAHAYFLAHSAEQARYLMSDERGGAGRGARARRAARPGASCSACSPRSSPWTSRSTDGVRKMPMPELINLRSHPRGVHAAPGVRGGDRGLGDREGAARPRP